MKMELYQIRAMAYYEFRMLWRERALLVITLALLFMSLISSWIALSEIVQRNDSAFDVLVDAELSIAQIIVFLIWGPVGASLALLLPIFMADVIPKDRQIGVRELFDALPVANGTYLLGKLVGAWLAVGSSMVIIMVIIGVLWFARAGTFDLQTYLDMWLWGALPLVIINGGLGTLLAATQPTRRRAILVMIAISIGLLFFGFGNLESNSMALLRGPVLFYFLNVDVEVSQQLFWQTLLVGLAQLLIAWVAVWGWLRWQDSKR